MDITILYSAHRETSERKVIGESASIRSILSDVFSWIFDMFWRAWRLTGDLAFIFPTMLANYCDMQEESLGTKFRSLKGKSQDCESHGSGHSARHHCPDMRTTPGGLTPSTFSFIPALPDGLPESCTRMIIYHHGLNACVPSYPAPNIYMLET